MTSSLRRVWMKKSESTKEFLFCVVGFWTTWQKIKAVFTSKEAPDNSRRRRNCCWAHEEGSECGVNISVDAIWCRTSTVGAVYESRTDQEWYCLPVKARGGFFCQKMPFQDSLATWLSAPEWQLVTKLAQRYYPELTTMSKTYLDAVNMFIVMQSVNMDGARIQLLTIQIQSPSLHHQFLKHISSYVIHRFQRTK